MAEMGPLEKNDQPQRDKLNYEAILGLKGTRNKLNRKPHLKKVKEPLLNEHNQSPDAKVALATQ